MTRAEVAAFLDEIEREGLPTREIGFTGGEPFMNPDILAMLGDALARGHSVLVLTNAMQPMQRPRIKSGLLALREAHGDGLVIRVSLDHYGKALHEEERGPDTYDKTVEGIDWLARNGFALALAGRTCWGESEGSLREGYARLLGSAAGRSMPTILRSSCCFRRWTSASMCRRSPRPAGASCIRARAM